MGRKMRIMKGIVRNKKGKRINERERRALFGILAFRLAYQRTRDFSSDTLTSSIDYLVLETVVKRLNTEHVIKSSSSVELLQF